MTETTETTENPGTADAWLGVVSASHVRSGVAQGIAQVNHGKRGPLARMRAGDTLVYYSPREGMREGDVVKSFTAIGEFPDDEIWQEFGGMASTTDFHPFRRRVDWHRSARIVPIAELDLELTSTPNWGYSLRRGLLPLSVADAAAIRDAMLAS